MFKSLQCNHWRLTQEQRLASKNIITGDFWDFLFYFIYHCFICRPLDSTVSEDAGIEPRTVATLALAGRRSDYSAIDLILSRLDLILSRLDLVKIICLVEN